MEWYFGKEVDDLVVPKDYEQQSMITSPESWSQWGMNGFGGSSLPNKSFNSNTKLTREELTFNGGKNFYTSIDMAADSDNERSKSNNSSMSQELYNNGGSLLWNDQADFQQFTEEEARINHMDDIFFSLLEEDPSKRSSGPHDNTIIGNNVNIFNDEMLSSQNIDGDEQSLSSSKYLKTHAFSSSTDWGNAEASTTYHMPTQYATNENSMEESVLNDLERVTAQFTAKTRICFRDAFYRLAESSKQPINSCPDGESMVTSNDDLLRARETEDTESKTNVIDRAVANLMFHKSDVEEIDDQQQQQQQRAFSCYQHQTDYDNYAEVPVRGMQELQQPTAY
ncbi:protein LNK3-like isoform X2 [Rutidosis leptorrhynchoides]|uniref:protein LNK3-like isoform X2 n=1 Tax=Rutidosis leptorrhynchoides TaxID=125765 RepID=UPI003A99E91F